MNLFNSAGESLRLSQSKAKASKPKLFITNGTEYPLKGTCVFFTRNNQDVNITNDNFSKVLAVCARIIR